MLNNELITELITYSILKKLELLNALIEKKWRTALWIRIWFNHEVFKWIKI